VSDLPTHAEMVDSIEEAHRQLGRLYQRLERVEAAMPPAGWQPNGYMSIANPADSLCRDCVTGAWSVWRYPNESGKPIATGKTAAEAAGRVPR
jgi:hypothetical protein